MTADGNIVTIRNLTKLYAQGEIQVTALDNISLTIERDGAQRLVQIPVLQ